MIEKALEYTEIGMSVIPVKPDKKPLIKWQTFQNEKAEPDQIREWWLKWPNANIGIVTGAISGVMVVDVDSQAGHDALNEFLPDNLTTPIATTPSGGWHYYFLYQPGLVNKARVITGCDVRTDGGYVVAPGSVGKNGKGYSWLPGLGLHQVEFAPMPGKLFNHLAECQKASTSEHIKKSSRGKAGVSDVVTCRQTSSPVVMELEQGRRDETIFHTANCLLKGGMDVELATHLVKILGKSCTPPFPENEVLRKIDSALKRLKVNGQHLSQDVRDFVLSSNGVFLSSDVVMSLQLSSRSEKQNLSKILTRLVDEGVIERTGNRNGQFRKINCDCDEMDFRNVDTDTVEIWLPFELHDLVEIMPGNIIVVAGEPNAGKTGLLLNIIRNNMLKAEVHYFNSEMGGSELKKRLKLFDDILLHEWKFKAWERSDNFADVIKPGRGKINIIDFLEIHDNFYEVGGMLADIHKKLKGAIAIVALQKNAGTDTGLGGFRSLEKPRLYLSMAAHRLKIVKAKNWKTSENPNGKQVTFKVAQGCKFIRQRDWHKPEIKRRAAAAPVAG